MSQQLWTVEAYLEFERASEASHEFRDGYVFLRPRSSRYHSVISVNTLASIHSQLRNRDGVVLSCGMRLKVSATGLYTYADGCVVLEAPQLEDTFKDTLLNPTLILEVPSIATEGYDRGRKFQHYRRLDSLREYLLISQDEPYIEHYVRQPNGNWLFSDVVGLDAVLELPSIQCTLALADVYAKVSFESA